MGRRGQEVISKGNKRDPGRKAGVGAPGLLPAELQRLSLVACHCLGFLPAKDLFPPPAQASREVPLFPFGIIRGEWR